jgi:hypothetical protein
MLLAASARTRTERAHRTTANTPEWRPNAISEWPALHRISSRLQARPSGTCRTPRTTRIRAFEEAQWRTR